VAPLRRWRASLNLGQLPNRDHRGETNLRIISPFFLCCSTAGLALALAGCETTPAPKPAAGGGYYKVGNPYQIAGTWYYPKEQPDYDETGIGSWYGSQFHGRLTANGEIFDRNTITAAHPTLPMPVNARVTNLENGKSIVVRINDRGPFANGRIIDLSEKAADLLGYRIQGTARVRVTYLGRADKSGPGIVPPAQETPPEIATAVAAAPSAAISSTPLPPVPGVAVAPPPPISAAPLPPPISEALPALPETAVTGEVDKVPVPAVTAIYVQAGAYSSLANADRVVLKLKDAGARIVTSMQNGKPVYRVRVGPLQDVGQADQTLQRVHALGHEDVKIVVE